MFWNSIILCRCLFSYSFTIKKMDVRSISLWSGTNCFFLERIQRIGQLILLQDMSRNDLAKKYGITSWFQLWFLCHLIENHYEIAAKAHLSHSWEPLRFFTWRQQQIWCLKALRNEEICQRLSTCGNFSNCCWCSLVFFFFRPLERLHDLTWMVTRYHCKPTRCV